jgi:protein-S-isoprenylcysteine O-methyltransferase Ste14
MGVLDMVSCLDRSEDIVEGPALALAGVAAYSLLHSALAGLRVKAAARRLLGPLSDRYYRLVFNVLGIVTFLPVLAVPIVFPGRRLYVVPWPWSGLMMAGQLAAILVVAIGLLQTDVWHFLGLRQLSGPLESRPATLVTGGLYRHVRHPLYTAGLAFLWLTPIMTTTLLALYAGLSVYLYVGSLFEERRLLAEFGQAYADYQRRVPRLIPRLFRAP